MIVTLNKNTSTRKKQMTHFGDARSATLVKSTVLTALNTNAKDLKITPKQAIDRLQKATHNEDKTGKSILRRAIQEISEKLS